MRQLYIAEVLNLISMFFTKLSIATFLMYLDFAKRYKVIIWLTIVIIFAINGIMTLVTILGSCNPIVLNWDKSGPGSCWPRSVNAIATYIQSSKLRKWTGSSGMISIANET